MKYKRSLETPEERRQRGIDARARLRDDGIQRMLARCKLEATEDRRLIRAYQFGLRAKNSRTYRARVALKESA